MKHLKYFLTGAVLTLILILLTFLSFKYPKQSITALAVIGFSIISYLLGYLVWIPRDFNSNDCDPEDYDYDCDEE